MYKVHVEKECGCFRKSNFENGKVFASKDEALSKAQAMVEDMNEVFCQKHEFAVMEDGDTFKIRAKER